MRTLIIFCATLAALFQLPAPAQDSDYADIAIFEVASERMTLDGFSGAPVFAFEHLNPMTVRIGFAGMMIRASYFIDGEIIVEALKKVRAGNG